MFFTYSEHPREVENGGKKDECGIIDLDESSGSDDEGNKRGRHELEADSDSLLLPGPITTKSSLTALIDHCVRSKQQQPQQQPVSSHNSSTTKTSTVKEGPIEILDIDDDDHDSDDNYQADNTTGD